MAYSATKADRVHTNQRFFSSLLALQHCSADEVVFTSGGSESNNHALKGVFFARDGRGGVLFVFVMMKIGSRRVLRYNVTAHPSQNLVLARTAAVFR
jgi:hypothetical protein